MGLDFTGANASWSYGGFGRFRERLAKVCGFDLETMEGFGGSEQRPWVAPWTGTAGDLIPLLHHSDCEGEISPQDCARVAKRLREVLAHNEFTQDLYDYDRDNGLLLAEGMEACARDGVALEFR